MLKKTLTSAAALMIVSSQAFCAIVDSGPISIAVPRTIDGLYFNVVAGTTGATGGVTAGWDFNPYGATTPGFFWPTNAVANSAGGVGVGTSYTNLPVGTVIGPASTYILTAGGGTPNFNTAGPKIVGFRLLNETTNAVNYGYATLNIAADLAATVTRLVYENAGASITVAGGGGGNTVVAPTSSAAAPVSIGTTGAGGTPASANITISAPAANTGNVTITSCTALAAPFSYTPAPTFPITIAPGAAANIPVQFAPAAGTAAGPVAANFTCQTSATPASFQVFVQGTVSAAPLNTLTIPTSSAAAPIVIGSAAAGSAGVTSNIAISAPLTNTGPVLISACKGLSGLFSFSPAPTFPISVAAGATVNLPVRFVAPLGTPVGPQAISFTCQTNGSPVSFQVFAQGNVTAALIPAIAVPSLSLWGMLVMALTLVGFSLVAMRRSN